jgi:uncharacterized membrane protein YqhA
MVDPEGGTDKLDRVAELVLAKSRYAVVIPVVLLLLAALGTFVYGVVFLVDSVRRIVDHPFPIGANEGYFVLLVDLSLVGATLLVASYGLYELFVTRNDRQMAKGVMPSWLVMRDLNDLKVRVVSLIVLVAAVSFVDVVVDFESGRDVLFLGVGVSALVVGLTVFIRFGTKDHE